MIAEINTLLSDVDPVLAHLQHIKRIPLGESFSQHPALRNMIRLIQEQNISGASVSLPADMWKQESFALPDKTMALHLFVLLVNNYIDAAENKLVSGSENILKPISQLLHIEEADYNSLMKWYSAHKPYMDTVGAAYFAFEQKNDLVRSKGVNVYFTHKNPGEILYLKYLDNYNVFLVRTFITDVFKDDAKTKDINIMDARTFSSLMHESLTFDDLVSEIKKFDPLQYVEISETSYNPRILLDPFKCLITFSGASSPISTTVYFDPIFEWLNLFDMADKKALSVHFKFKYYNTYTSKFLLNFVLACNRIAAKGKDLSYYWYHDIDDDEMREFGEYLQTQCSKPAGFHVLETY